MKARHRTARWRRILHLRRRPLAALCAFAAVFAALSVLAPAPTPTVRVWVATGDLPAGTVVTQADLAPLDAPPAVIPDGAPHDAETLIGRTLAGPIAGGSILTEASVSAGSRLAREGHVVMALSLSGSAIADLVQPGVGIDVLDADGAVLVSDARVVAPPEDADAGLSLGASSRSALIEVPDAVAAVLAVAAQGSLTVVVR